MIISIASGKGGTGKTMIATSLTLALKEKYSVELLDCDVEEPNDSIFIKPDINRLNPVTIPVPEIDEERCTYCGKCAEVCAYNAIAVIQGNVLVFPELCHGCGACSYLCPEDAINEKGKEIGVIERGNSDGVVFVQGKLSIGQPMAPPIIREVKKLSGGQEITIIDASPGTSCPVVEAIKDSDFCLLVTEPTPFGLNDLRLAVETVRKIDLPFGVLLNRVGTGDNKTQEYCQEENIPILMTIPLDKRIAGMYSRGITLVEGMPEYRERFLLLFQAIREIVIEGNSDTKR